MSENLSVSRRRFISLTLAAGGSMLIPAPKLFAQDGPFKGESAFNRILQKALDAEWDKLPMGQIVGNVGIEFLGTPYVGWTLEVDVDREFCFVTLEGLDCVTFFESSLGFARMLKRWRRDVASKAAPNVRIRRPLPEDLVREVSYTRYRGGKVGDYSTRLHYTSDWMFDNVEKDVVENVGELMKGAKPLGKTINYMSSHPDTYKQLKANSGLIVRIKSTEQTISERDNWFVPKNRLAENASRFKTGDIIGLATTMEGMDIAHTGMIVVEGGIPLFVHASSTQKKVVKDASVVDVANRLESYTGVMVVRPIETLR